MVAEKLSKACLENMSSSMISHSGFSCFLINLSSNCVAFRNNPAFNYTIVHKYSVVVFNRIFNFDFAISSFNNAYIACLTATLCIERGLIKNDYNLIVSTSKFYSFAILDDCKNLSVIRKLSITEELCLCNITQVCVITKPSF